MSTYQIIDKKQKEPLQNHSYFRILFWVKYNESSLFMIVNL